MSDAAQTFNEAYDLIEQGDLATARQLLDDIRAENETNPDFWWLYAHATEDEAAGRDALQRVQQLNPQYPGLDNLSEKAGVTIPRPNQPPPPPMRSTQDLPPPPRMDSMGDDGFDDTDVDFTPDEAGGLGSVLRNPMVLIAVAVVVIVFIVLLVPGLLGGGEQPTPTPTVSVLVNPTDVPVATSAPVTASDTPTDVPTAAPTEETAVVEGTSDEATSTDSGDYAALAAQVADFNVPQDGIEVGETSAGNTLLITTCSLPGPAATQAIVNIAEAIKTEPIADDIEAIGFRITNCDAGSVLVTLGVSRNDFDDFADDTISASELQGLLRPL